MIYKTKKELVFALKSQLGTSNRQAVKGLLAVYNAQTIEEQSKSATLEKNCVGFSAPDAQFLSYLARWKLTTGYLTTRQLNVVRRRMPKYAAQLVDYSLEQGKIRKVKGGYTW